MIKTILLADFQKLKKKFFGKSCCEILRKEAKEKKIALVKFITHNFF